MPGTTPLGITYPTLGDSADITELETMALSIDSLLSAAAPAGDSGYSAVATSDVPCPESVATTMLSSTFTLTRDQWVLLSGKAMWVNVGSNGGKVALAVVRDGAFNQWCTNGWAFINNSGPNTGSIVVPMFSEFLPAGVHTVELQAHRDNAGVFTALSTDSVGTGRDFHPTTLNIIV